MERLPASSANQKVQMRADVGKIVHPNSEATRHLSERVANGAIVLSKRPRPTSPIAREYHVHRSAGADGTLQLAAPLSDGSPVLRSRELCLNLAGKERPLHEKNICLGQCYLGNKCA
jgi:hypothetical protein